VIVHANPGGREVVSGHPALVNTVNAAAVRAAA